MTRNEKIPARKIVAVEIVAAQKIATSLLLKPSKYILKYILNLALPPLCPICRTQVAYKPAFCSDCFSLLKFTKKPFCISCSFQFQSYVKHKSRCLACTARPPAFDQAFAPLLYDKVARTPILALKHADQTHLAPLFANIISTNAPEEFQSADMVVPVPLHPKRLRKRMFNQAVLLAKIIAKKWKIPLRLNLLERKKYTPPLGNLSPSKRLLTLRAVFQCNYPEIAKEKSILLIDDVMTSGLTAEFCARALKQAGAKKVRVLTIAKVPLPRPNLARNI